MALGGGTLDSHDYSGQIIIFHQPRFPGNKGTSLTKPRFGVRSCEVAIIWPDYCNVWTIPNWCGLLSLHATDPFGTSSTWLPNAVLLAFITSSSLSLTWRKKQTWVMTGHVWVFPKIMVPQNGWFIRENPIKMDDLGRTPPIFGNIHLYLNYSVVTMVTLEHFFPAPPEGRIRNMERISTKMVWDAFITSWWFQPEVGVNHHPDKI